MQWLKKDKVFSLACNNLEQGLTNYSLWLHMLCGSKVKAGTQAENKSENSGFSFS